MSFDDTNSREVISHRSFPSLGIGRHFPYRGASMSPHGDLIIRSNPHIWQKAIPHL